MAAPRSKIAALAPTFGKGQPKGGFTYGPDGRVTGRKFRTTTKLGKKMEERGVKLYEVAGSCGFSERLLTDYLAGRKTPSTDKVRRMAGYLGCNVKDILEDDVYQARRKVGAL